MSRRIHREHYAALVAVHRRSTNDQTSLNRYKRIDSGYTSVGSKPLKNAPTTTLTRASKSAIPWNLRGSSRESNATRKFSASRCVEWTPRYVYTRCIVISGHLFREFVTIIATGWYVLINGRDRIYISFKRSFALWWHDKITRNAKMDDLKNNYFLVLKISCVSMTYKNKYFQLFTEIVHNACDNI